MPEFSEAEELNEEMSEASDKSKEDDNSDLIWGHLAAITTVTQVSMIGSGQLEK